MDPLDLLILGLRVGLIVLLYAFLWLVLRVARSNLDPVPAAEVDAAAPALPRAPRAAAPPTAGPARTAAPAPLRLLVEEAAGTGLVPGQSIEVHGSALVGRSDQAELVLRDPTVSSEHARLEPAADGWQVRDLGSTNGTQVNGRPASVPSPLRPGDVLGLGSVRLRVS